jgi:menaquinone-dependent protoporphyrinogen oxidase
MSSRQILLVYGTSYGQTAKVARHMAQVLIKSGDRVTIVNAAEKRLGLNLRQFDAIIVGGSIIGGRHQRTVTRFVRENLAALNTTPSAFFSVSGAAASPNETSRADAQRVIDEFLGQTGWYPRVTAAIAGAMTYTKYNPIVRWIVRRAAKPMGGPTDTSRDHEFTDWSQVERFVRGFVATVSVGRMDQPQSAFSAPEMEAHVVGSQ